MKKESLKKYSLIAGLLLLLVAIRFFERQLFNDGLIDFFRYDYLKSNLPGISKLTIVLTDSLRYWINSLISITILYLLFKRRDLPLFLFSFYLLAFIAGLVFFVYALNHYQPGEYLVLFYIRRFFIQPVLLLVLIPALLYHKKNEE